MNLMSAIIGSLLLLAALPSFAAGPVRVSASDEQTGMEVTVYNNNLGLIKDTRKMDLPKGEGELRFMDVASQIMPYTVRVKSVNSPEAFTVLEQNYEYDLINAAKLLDKYVGKGIKIIDWNKFQDRKETVDATLLSNNQGPIYKIKDEIYLGHPGIQVLPGLPENLVAKPTLTWLYESAAAAIHNLEVSYLTQNINWKADYVMIVNKDDTAADLSGWVSLDNQSGATYTDARLKLVAGEVHRVGLELERPMAAAEAPKRAKTEQFQEKAFFEYHIYDLQRKTTLKDKQTKQVSLLQADSAKIRKELVIYGAQTYFTRLYRENIPKQPVNVYIQLKNSKENGLGMPLPAGVVRVYKRDDDDSQQFIGEDRVLHTPKDEELKLKMGEAFDVVAERVQKDYKQLTRTLHESEWEVTIRNHKDREITVAVVEPIPGNWEMVRSSHPFKKVDAFTIRFEVKVPKDVEDKINYRVKVGL